MRAAVMRNGQLVVDDVPDPVPGPGQILVKTLACGICGSDLHFLQHAPRMVDMADEFGTSMGSGPRLDLSQDIVMGHEFSAEVLELGADVTGVSVGDIVTSIPAMVTAADMTKIEPIGAYSNTYNGGYAERMLLSGMLALQVPNGLDPATPRSPSPWLSASMR